MFSALCPVIVCPCLCTSDSSQVWLHGGQGLPPRGADPSAVGEGRACQTIQPYVTCRYCMITHTYISIYLSISLSLSIYIYIYMYIYIYIYICIHIIMYMCQLAIDVGESKEPGDHTLGAAKDQTRIPCHRT